jgi:thiosulfate reductase cytochrome b subunit
MTGDATRRLALERWVNGAALLVLVGLALSGGILHWTSLPGRGWLKQIHSWLAQGFLVLMVVHLLLHRRWIAKNLLGHPRDQR